MKSTLFLVLCMLLAGVALSIQEKPNKCIFQQTHCQCGKIKTPRSCLRFVSGKESNALCRSDICSSGGYECDCFGDSICELQLCGSWKPIESGYKAAVGTNNVPCFREEHSSLCAIKQEVYTVEVGSGASRGLCSPVFYDDKDNRMERFWKEGRGMEYQWSDRFHLVPRQINMRIYRTSDPEKLTVCMILNTYATERTPRPHSLYNVDSKITGLNGQKLRFTQCDDYARAPDGSLISDCRNPETASVQLDASNEGMTTRTDGWCVGYLQRDGKAVKIELSNVYGMEGINFQNANGTRTTFLFREKKAGLEGPIDHRGLVQGGKVPSIIIKLSGLA